MARTVLPIVGAAAGSYFFGSAQLGFLAGSVAGGLVDPGLAQGPRIGEAPVQTSHEGVPRAIIYGTATCTGFVLCTGPALRTTEITTAGKGAPKTEGQVIYRNYAIGICEGPIAGILRVWENDKLVYDVRTGSLMLAESAKWVANKVFYLGDEDQLPDVYLQMNVSGIGETPAYRGTAYMVFGLEDLTETAGAIKQYRWEVATEGAPAEIGELTESITIPAYGPLGPLYWVPSIFTRADGKLGAGTWTSIVNISPPGAVIIYEYEADLTIASSTSISIVGAWDHDAPTNNPSSLYPRSYTETQMVSADTIVGHGACLFSTAGALVATLKPTAAFDDKWWGIGGTSNYEHDARNIWFSDTHVYIGTVFRNNVNVNNIARWARSAGGFSATANAVISGICVTPGLEFFMHLDNAGNLRVINDVGNLTTYDEDMDFVSIEALPFSLIGFHGFGIEGNIGVFVYSNPTPHIQVRRVSDWSLIKSVAASGASQPGNTKVIFTATGCYVQCGLWLARLAYTSGGQGGPTTLGAIVADLCDRARLAAADYDVSELTDLVEGLTLAGDYTAASAIDTLRGAYFFDKAEYDTQIHFPKRGKPVVASLTLDDLVEEPDTSYREQASELPKKLHLFYQHAASGYAQVKATSSRSSPDARVVGELSRQVPVVLDVDEAAQIADKLHKVAWADAMGEVKFTVPLSFIRLVPSNCIALSLRGQVSRLRIEQIEDVDGVRKLTLRHDRQGAYTSDATGVPIPAPTLPPSTIVGDTVLAVMDLPARIESEDDLNYLVAGTGTSPGWYGYTLQRSLDAGANYQTVDTFHRAAVMGSLVNDVPSSAAGIPDRTNTVRVHLFRAGQVIESITELQFLTEGGAFALEKPDGSYEVMQYLDANEDSNGIFELSTLHRGRLNSGASAHTAGAKFVLLSDAAHILAQFSYRGQALTHRAPSLGQSPELADPQTQTFVGRSQIEWPVAYLTLSRDGSDLISAVWYPRHRFGTDVAPVASRNLRGFRVTLNDGVLPAVSFGTDPFDPSVTSFTYDASALGAPLTVSVAAINRITGPGPATSGVV